MKLSKTEKVLNTFILFVVVFVYFIFGVGSILISGVLFLTLLIWTLYLRRISKVRMEKKREEDRKKANEYKNRIY